MPDDLAPFPPFWESIATAAARPGDPPWLAGLRARARARYAAAGWPHARTESWKYTSLNALAAEAFAPAPGRDAPAAARAPEVDGPRLVLANGVFRPDLSDPGGPGAGVAAMALDDAPEEVRAGLAAAVEETDSTDGLPLAALSTAALAGGIFLDIAPGAAPGAPIHIVSAADGEGAALAPRIVVRAGRDSAADVVESHVGPAGGRYFANAVTQVSVGRGARLGHAKAQNEGARAFHIALTLVEAAERAEYDNFALAVGARLARNEIRVRVAGTGAECRIDGAYLGAGGRHLDNTVFIDHAAPGCRSRQAYKGVLADRARGVFQGKSLVRREAQRTDAHQMNRALLLSDKAEIDSKPELEIYADDVRCGHGATVGELEADQLFYLRARGLSRAAARRMLVAGYVDDAIGAIRCARTRGAFARLAAGWLDSALDGDAR